VTKSAGKTLEISAEFPETPKSAGKWSGCKIPQKIPWEYPKIRR
jgi:hypothetical protein